MCLVCHDLAMDAVLFDGTYELFRAHFGAPPRSAADGAACGAAVGMAASLLSFLRSRSEPVLTAVAFDQVIESFRNDLLGSYKSSAGVEPELLAQFPLAEELAGALGFAVWPMVELEADDALATGALGLAADPRVGQIRIATPDKDLAQVVSSDRVVCWDRRRDLLLDEPGVLARFGAPPGSIPDWLALVGDAADGIPGVPGWGATSSGAVLGAYRHLEAIPLDPARWSVPVRGAARLARALADHLEAAYLYREVATLRRDAAVELSPEALEWRGARRLTLEPLLEQLGAGELLERVPRWADE